MAATRRLTKELSEIKKRISDQQGKDKLDVEDDFCVGKCDPDENNMLIWHCILTPRLKPFSDGTYKIKIEFPAEYPFKPPKIQFETKIYHPNIDEKGQVCLPIINTDHWKPATKTETVLTQLVNLIHRPEPEHPLRADVAEEFSKRRQNFDKKASEYAKKYGGKRTDI